MVVANLANDIWITKHAPIRLKLVSFEPFLSLVFRNGFNFFVCYQLLVHFWPFRVKNMLKMAKKVDICQSSFQQHWKHISCKSVALEAYFMQISSIGSTKNYFGSLCITLPMLLILTVIDVITNDVLPMLQIFMKYASNAIDLHEICFQCY